MDIIYMIMKTLEILITGSFFVVILTSVFIPYILYIYSMYEMGDIRL